MKMFIPLLCLLSLAVAEPPVGDGYPASRSSHGHHDHNHDHSDLQRSPSLEYGPPSRSGTARNALSTEYGPPNARNTSPRQNYPSHAARSSFSKNLRSRNQQKSISQEYGAPNARSGPSQEYGTPNTRSQGSSEHSGLSQEYGLPNTRSGLSSDDFSHEYRAPNPNSISQEYGSPAQRLSQEYGAPDLSSRSLSTEYGVPDARSNPSEEYGAPAVARSGHSTNSFRSQGYSSARSVFQPKSAHNYAARSNQLSHSPKSASFGRSKSHAAKNTAQTYAPSSSYGVPKDSDSGYSQEFNALPESYGIPAAKDLSDTYGVPSANSLPHGYDVSSRGNLKTSAIASSYSSDSARSSPSSTYLPSARDAMPSEQYGVPEHDDRSQGYNYARDGFAGDDNQEPANYDFSYKVNDFESGSDFGHSESRQENRAEGSYFVVLPDGTKQTVEYEADERGFNPRISVEPADLSRNGGYDENASDLGRSGPY